jgi:hypothetical protein
MQTFLPYADFERIAQCLDLSRHCAMLRESQQTLDTLLLTPTKKGTIRRGYLHHPILNLWRGYEDALKLYINKMREGWLLKGKNSKLPFYVLPHEVKMPPWIGDERLHKAHRSQLYYKNPQYYSQFNWIEANEPLKDYIWEPSLL